MRLLAFDQSSHITGYCVFDNGKLIYHNKFNLTDLDVGDRLVKLRTIILKLIETFKPDQVAYEDIQFQEKVPNNVATFKTLAEVFGVFDEVLTEIGMEFTVVPSVTWKKALKIKGAHRPEQKKNAGLYVARVYGIHPTEDECDSICIGDYVANHQDYDWSD